MTEQITTPIKNIRIPKNRGRKEFKNIQAMSESIREHGIIHPPTVTSNADGTYTLVAGERRFRGAVLAGLTHLPITIRDDLSELERRGLELEENVQRSDLTWDEQVDLLAELHKLKLESDPNWCQKDTAELTRQSQAHVSLQLTVAKKLADDPELRARVKKLDIRSAAKVIKREEQEAKARRLQSQGKLEITQEFQHGDCRNLIEKLPDNSVDLVLMDPPYGLAKLEDLKQSPGTAPGRSFALTSDTHNLTLDEVLNLLQDLAPELVRVLKPGSHVYVFSAFQYVGDFIDALSPLEFQPPCMVWDHERVTQPGLGYNYMSRCEPILMFHNPPRAKRLAKSMVNIISHPEIPRGMDRFATAKPEGLLRILIEQSTILGDTVLDPFGGSGSTLRAARLSSRKGLSFEIDEPTYQRTLLNLNGES